MHVFILILLKLIRLQVFVHPLACLIPIQMLMLVLNLKLSTPQSKALSSLMSAKLQSDSSGIICSHSWDGKIQGCPQLLPVKFLCTAWGVPPTSGWGSAAAGAEQDYFNLIVTVSQQESWNRGGCILKLRVILCFPWDPDSMCFSIQPTFCHFSESQLK